MTGESIAHPHFLPIPGDPPAHLRLTRAEDAPEIYKIVGDNPSLSDYIYWMNVIKTTKDAEEHVDYVLNEMEQGKGVQFRIIPGDCPESGAIGGTVGVFKLKKDEALASCWLTEDLQGKRYGRRSVETVLHYAVAAFGLRTIKLDIEKGNLPSQKLAERLGFERRGSFSINLEEMAGSGEQRRSIQVWRRDYDVQ